MKTTPYWWEATEWQSAPWRNAGSSQIPAKVDAAIIGAGYSGLNAALVLARAGLSVVVFEAGALGEGASSRNGGMVGPSFHKLGIKGLKAKFGEETAYGILRESVGFVDYLEDFLKSEGIDAEFYRTGRFLGARKPAHFDGQQRMLETLQEVCNVRGHMVPKSQQHTEIETDHYEGGLVFDMDGGLHPAKYLSALAMKVSEAGAQIATETPVTEVSKNVSGYQLSTPTGKITADRVAVCTNGYTGKQFPGLRRRVLPLRSAIIATQELPSALTEKLMPTGRMYGDSRRMVIYYRLSPDKKRILFGGRATGIRDEPEINAKLLRTTMLEILPQLSKIEITHIWSGLVAYAFDHTPHIGQGGANWGNSGDGVYYAMGYCGSGVARSSYFGNKLGYKMLDETEQGRTAFDELSFVTKPLYSGNPWFMPALLSWHQFLDRFKL